MIKIRYHICVLFLCCSFNFTVLASNFAEEENFVTSFADSAISILSSDSLSDAERTSSFTELVMSSIDLNLISKFVLSKAWKDASDEQKEEYLIAFKDYFVKIYTIGFYSGFYSSLKDKKWENGGHFEFSSKDEEKG